MMAKRYILVLLSLMLVVIIALPSSVNPAPASTPQETTIFIGGHPAEWLSRIKGALIADVIERGTPYNTKMMGGLGLISRERFAPVLEKESYITIDIGGLWGVYESLKRVAPDLVERIQYLALFPDQLQLVPLIVYKDLPFDSLREAIDTKQGIKIGAGRAGSWQVVDLIWRAMGAPKGLDSIKEWGGMVEKSTTPPRLADLMREGQLNAYMCFGPAFHAGLQAISSSRPLKLCSIAGDEGDLRRVKEASKVKGVVTVSRYVMKKDHYTFVTEDTPILAVPKFWIASTKMPDEVAYAITKAVWEERKFLGRAYGEYKDINPEVIKMIKELGYTYHPGAERFYKEAGILK